MQSKPVPQQSDSKLHFLDYWRIIRMSQNSHPRRIPSGRFDDRSGDLHPQTDLFQLGAYCD